MELEPLVGKTIQIKVIHKNKLQPKDKVLACVDDYCIVLLSEKKSKNKVVCVRVPYAVKQAFIDYAMDNHMSYGEALLSLEVSQRELPEGNVKLCISLNPKTYHSLKAQAEQMNITLSALIKRKLSSL
ncbi:MAG: hypothetical protein ACK42C_00030 [Aquificaceae bacterium]